MCSKGTVWMGWCFLLPRVVVAVEEMGAEVSWRLHVWWDVGALLSLPW